MCNAWKALGQKVFKISDQHAAVGMGSYTSTLVIVSFGWVVLLSVRKSMTWDSGGFVRTPEPCCNFRMAVTVIGILQTTRDTAF